MEWPSDQIHELCLGASVRQPGRKLLVACPFHRYITVRATLDFGLVSKSRKLYFFTSSPPRRRIEPDGCANPAALTGSVSGRRPVVRRLAAPNRSHRDSAAWHPVSNSPGWRQERDLELNGAFVCNVHARCVRRRSSRTSLMNRMRYTDPGTARPAGFISSGQWRPTCTGRGFPQLGEPSA